MGNSYRLLFACYHRTLGGCKYIDVAPGGIYFASASTDQSLKIFRVDDGSLISSFGNEVQSKKNWIDFSPDGLRLAVGHQNGVLGVWNLGPVLGEELFDLNSSCVVYPNPTQDYINLQGITLPATLILYNLYGQEVYQKKMQSSTADIRELPNGIYMGVLTTQQNNTVPPIKIQILH